MRMVRFLKLIRIYQTVTRKNVFLNVHLFPCGTVVLLFMSFFKEKCRALTKEINVGGLTDSGKERHVFERSFVPLMLIAPHIWDSCFVIISYFSFSNQNMEPGYLFFNNNEIFPNNFICLKSVVETTSKFRAPTKQINAMK